MTRANKSIPLVFLLSALFAGGCASTSQNTSDPDYGKIWSLPELLETGTPPRPVRQVRPILEGERVTGAHGVSVNVHFIVMEDGTVRAAEVSGDYAPEHYVKAAVEAISQWVFRPGTVNRTPVRVRMSVPINF